MKNVTRLVGLSFTAILLLTACGGGGGDGTPTTAATTTSFATANFSGKSLYYVSNTAYSLATFDANGSALSSNLIAVGTPVLNPTAALWTVSNGELLISFEGATQRYTLVSTDAANRYYKVIKHSDNGTINTVGMFYDQATGLAQAQNFVATRQVP
jgi:hypothetical protein